MSTDLEKSTDKKDKAKEPKKNFSFKELWAFIVKFYKDHKAEFDKITWPNRKDLINKTVTVVFTSLIFGLIIFGLDGIYQVIVKFILGLVS